MASYCMTINERKGRRVYGVDLLEYKDGEFIKIMSRPQLTESKRLARKIVDHANRLQVPDYLFDEFVVAVALWE